MRLWLIAGGVLSVIAIAAAGVWFGTGFRMPQGSTGTTDYEVGAADSNKLNPPAPSSISGTKGNGVGRIDLMNGETVQAPTIHLSGRCIAFDSRPLLGLSVEVYFGDAAVGLVSSARVRTDSAGTYRCEIPSTAVRARAVARADGGACLSIEHSIDPTASQVALPDIQVSRLPATQLACVDDFGDPIAGVRGLWMGPELVAAQSEGLGGFARASLDLGETDADGRLRVATHSERGYYALWTKPGFAEQLSHIPAGGIVGDLTITLHRLLQVEGIAPPVPNRSPELGPRLVIPLRPRSFAPNPGGIVKSCSLPVAATEGAFAQLHGQQTEFVIDRVGAFWPMLGLFNEGGETPMAIARLDPQAGLYHAWAPVQETSLLLMDVQAPSGTSPLAGAAATDALRVFLDWTEGGVRVGDSMDAQSGGANLVVARTSRVFLDVPCSIVAYQGARFIGSLKETLNPGQTTLRFPTQPSASPLMIRVIHAEDQSAIAGAQVDLTKVDPTTGRRTHRASWTSDKAGLVCTNVGFDTGLHASVQLAQHSQAVVSRPLSDCIRLPSGAMELTLSVPRNEGSVRVTIEDSHEPSAVYRCALGRASQMGTNMTQLESPRPGRPAQAASWEVKAVRVEAGQSITFDEIPEGRIVVYATPISEDAGPFFVLNAGSCASVPSLAQTVQVSNGVPIEAHLYAPNAGRARLQILAGMDQDPPAGVKVLVQRCAELDTGFFSTTRGTPHAARDDGLGLYSIELDSPGYHFIRLDHEAMPQMTLVRYLDYTSPAEIALPGSLTLRVDTQGRVSMSDVVVQVSVTAFHKGKVVPALLPELTRSFSLGPDGVLNLRGFDLGAQYVLTVTGGMHSKTRLLSWPESESAPKLKQEWNLRLR